MSRFSLRGSTALIALSLSLSLALPLSSRAQEPPAALLEVAEWQPVTRFGFSFAVPPGLAVEHDTPGLYAVSSLDDADTQGSYFAVQLLDPQTFAQAPARDSEEFTAFLSQVGRVPVEASGVVVQVGRFALHGYRGSAVGEDGIERHALFLVSQSLDENGEAMVIAVLSAGIGGAVAGALEARFLSSFAVVEDPAETPEAPPGDEDGAQDGAETGLPMAAGAPEETGAEAEELAAVGDPVAEPEAGADAATPVADTAPEAGAEADMAIASAAAEDGTDEVAEAGMAEGEAEAVAGADAAMAGAGPAASGAAGSPDGVLIADLVTLALPQGMRVMDRDDGPNSTDLRLADSTSPDTPHTRLAGGLLSRPVEQQARRLLAGVDALVEGEVGGLQVWVIHGPATRDLADTRVEAAAGIPAQVIVPRLCVDGLPPYMIGVLAAPGDEARLDAALAALRLSVPEGATDCADEVIAPVRAALEGGAAEAPVAQPDAPAMAEAVVPEDWERHTRFGLSFAAPAGMEIRSDRRPRDQMHIWLVRRDAAGAVRNEISVRVWSPEALATLPQQSPADPGFVDMLSAFAARPVAATDERLPLGDLTLRLYRSETGEPSDGAPVPMRVLFLIPETPAANGLSPWIALRTASQSPEAAEAFEQSFMASLSGTPQAPEAAPEAPPAAAQQPGIPMPPPPAVAREPEPRPATPSLAMGEAQTWEQALARGTPEAVLAYLAQYPRGLHSGEARGWLHARDIYPPDERRPVPDAVAPEPQPLTDEQGWQIAMADGRPQALWTYLKTFPQGAYAGRARAMLTPVPAQMPTPMPERPEPRPMK